MGRKDVYEFKGDDSGEPDVRLGPRPHPQEHIQPALHVGIGSREFRLDARPDPAATRILLVERDLLIRAALAALVSSWKGFQVVAKATTAKQAVAQRQMLPDVVLVSLSRIADMATLTDVSLVYGPDRLVVLLGHNAEDFRFEIGRHSHRVLMKNAPPLTLKKAIERTSARC